MFFGKKKAISLIGKLDPVVVARHALAQKYVRRNLVELDKEVNIVTDGAPDDTISSRMLRWKLNLVPKPNSAKQKTGQFMCWWLGIIQKDHDLMANIGDRARAQAEVDRTTKTIDASLK